MEDILNFFFSVVKTTTRCRNPVCGIFSKLFETFDLCKNIMLRSKFKPTICDFHKKSTFESCSRYFFRWLWRSMSVLFHWLSVFCFALMFNNHPSEGVDLGVALSTFSILGENVEFYLILDQGCCRFVFDLTGLCVFSSKIVDYLLLFCCTFLFLNLKRRWMEYYELSRLLERKKN